MAQPNKTHPDPSVHSRQTGIGTTSQSDLFTLYGCYNLRFLLDILAATRHTPKTFGKMTDKPASAAQTLRLQLKNDDMRLSKAKEVVSILTGGYELVVEFKDEYDGGREMPIAMPAEPSYYELILPEALRKNLARGTRMKKIDPRKNLAFLRSFLTYHGISQRALGKALGISGGAVETWLRRDDMAISYLFRIKDVYNLGLCFRLKAPKANVKKTKD